jgi:hypothetical protein
MDSTEVNMKRAIYCVLVMSLLANSAQAEFKRVEMTVFGMD